MPSFQSKKSWNTNSSHHLEKSFSFPNFLKALQFVNQVGELAEKANHHPDIFLSWGKVKIELWSHDVDSVTDRDFSLADQIDLLHNRT